MWIACITLLRLYSKSLWQASTISWVNFLLKDVWCPFIYIFTVMWYFLGTRCFIHKGFVPAHYYCLICLQHLMSGWLWDYSYICQPIDYSVDKKAMRVSSLLLQSVKLNLYLMLSQMANLCWWYYISKLSEFADTIFFVLRKKDSQVTFLHLYHHSLTPLETWILVKFLAGKPVFTFRNWCANWT